VAGASCLDSWLRKVGCIGGTASVVLHAHVVASVARRDGQTCCPPPPPTDSRECGSQHAGRHPRRTHLAAHS